MELDKKKKKAREDWMREVRKKIDYTKRKPPSEWKRRGPTITKSRFMNAVRGSCGISVRIAERLGVTYQALRHYLRKFPEQEEIIREEAHRLVSEAHQTVRDLMLQREEYAVALNAAKLVLVSKGGWTTRSEIQHITGKMTQVRSIQVESLSLCLRRKLLEEFETMEVKKITMKSA